MPGRRKRFDTLLAEHKNRARERERERELHQPHSQQNPSLRDPHPSTHLTAAHETYQVAHGNGLAPDATKPLSLSKPKFHGPNLPRYVLQITCFSGPAVSPNKISSSTAITVHFDTFCLNNGIHLTSRLNSSHGAGTPGDATVVHESPHHPQTTADGVTRHSSDEGENEEREDGIDKLDCHYSGYHPRPVAVSTRLATSTILARQNLELLKE